MCLCGEIAVACSVRKAAENRHAFVRARNSSPDYRVTDRLNIVTIGSLRQVPDKVLSDAALMNAKIAFVADACRWSVGGNIRGRKPLHDRDGYDFLARGAVGERGRGFAAFDAACAVDSPNANAILAVGRIDPGVLPEGPCDGRRIAEDGCWLPRFAVVKTDVDGLDAGEVPDGVTEKLKAARRDCGAVFQIGKTRVRTALTFVGPSLAFPVAQVRLFKEFDARHPFGLLHAELAGDEDTDWIAVHRRKVFAVHLPGDKILFVPQALERMPGGEPVGGVDGRMSRVPGRCCALDQRLQRRADPFGVAKRRPAHRIGNALKGVNFSDTRQLQQVLVVQSEGMFNEAVKLELPVVAINGGRAALGGDVEFVVGRNGHQGGLAAKLLVGFDREPGGITHAVHPSAGKGVLKQPDTARDRANNKCSPFHNGILDVWLSPQVP